MSSASHLGLWETLMHVLTLIFDLIVGSSNHEIHVDSYHQLIYILLVRIVDNLKDVIFRIMLLTEELITYL